MGLKGVMSFIKHEGGGKYTGRYVSNEDGSTKVAGAALAAMSSSENWNKVYGDIKDYKWNDGDFLLSSYPRNGTHFTWEIMSMLLKNSSEYITEPKESCMMDLFPISKTDEVFPRGIPRVLNTHYRLDVLPKVFHNKKTVLVIRNPKDAAVSYYHFYKQLLTRNPDLSVQERVQSLTFSNFLQMYMYDHDQPFSTYFDFTKAMWDMAKDNPNFFVVFYEELKQDPVKVIWRLNKFMETNCSPDVIQQIADVTSFTKMKQAKEGGSSTGKYDHITGVSVSDGDDITQKAAHEKLAMYRKGEKGAWKGVFTVADNEMFDAFLETWSMTKEIPYIYE